MTVKGAVMELRAVGGRPVLVGHDGTDEREVDPGNLALDRSLSEALQEWASVASAVQRSTDAGPAVAVVSRRGRQLAAQLAEIMGQPVSYADPLTGEVLVLPPPEYDDRSEDVPPDGPVSPAEPVPWLSGLTVSAFIFVLVFVAVLTLAVTLAGTNPLLAVASDVVVTAGLLPSVWLVRQTPIWRWIALGVAAAIAAGWLALPLILL
jgi:hypothetical protein